MKSLNPAKPWGPMDFFLAIGYHTHNLEGYVQKPESIVVPWRLPPAEQSMVSAETKYGQRFYLVPRHPDDPRVRVDISSGSCCINAS